MSLLSRSLATASRATMRNVAILVFDQVEVLDFAGPYEVFNVTGELNYPSPFNTFLVAETHAPVKARGHLSINANYSIHDMPKADILIVPGGAGTRALLKKPHLLRWLKTQADSVEKVASVCTGALVLAKAGVKADSWVTHHEGVTELKAILGPDAVILEDQRYVDHGKVAFSGGISAGVDLSLYLVRKILGDDALKKTLVEMEYSWTPDVDIAWKRAVDKLL